MLVPLYGAALDEDIARSLDADLAALEGDVTVFF
jgi:hypothetical protein